MGGILANDGKGQFSTKTDVVYFSIFSAYFLQRINTTN
jgi:hypothetical protein